MIKDQFGGFALLLYSNSFGKGVRKHWGSYRQINRHLCWEQYSKSWLFSLHNTRENHFSVICLMEKKISVVGMYYDNRFFKTNFLRELDIVNHILITWRALVDYTEKVGFFLGGGVCNFCGIFLVNLPKLLYLVGFICVAFISVVKRS